MEIRLRRKNTSELFSTSNAASRRHRGHGRSLVDNLRAACLANGGGSCQSSARNDKGRRLFRIGGLIILTSPWSYGVVPETGQLNEKS